MEVVDLQRPKSRPEIGFVLSQVTVVNQDGVPVMEFLSKGIFPRAT